MQKLSLFILCCLVITLNAQTKQEVYCNPSIVWAGIVDIDMVPNLSKDQNWDTFAESGYSKLNFNQKSEGLKESGKTLSDYVIKHANDGTLDFYNDATLKSKIDYQLLELTDPNIEPETIGDRGKEYPASNFEVYRLRCLLYYEKDQLDFKLVPQAVAVIRTEYDGPYSKAFYNTLGWLPVQEWTKTMQATDENITWAQNIHSDIALRKIRVFKQEQTIKEVFEQDLIANILKKTNEVQLLTTNNFEAYKPMTKDEIIKACNYEIPVFDDENFEESTIFQPKSAYDFVGINFSINWAWNNTNKQFYIQQTQYSPILHNMDNYNEHEEYKKEMFLNYMFSKKVNN